MNRILLAVLALLAGLFAQVTPAQARLSGNSDTEINSVESVRGTARGTSTQSAPAEAPAARAERREREATHVRPSRSRVIIPSVFLGVDRAIE
jgi:hypothetical protein